MRGVQERVAHVEGQVNELSQRLTTVEAAIHHLEQRMDARFETLDGKMSRQFMWLVGIQVTTLAAIMTTLAAIVIAVIPR